MDSPENWGVMEQLVAMAERAGMRQCVVMGEGAEMGQCVAMVQWDGTGLEQQDVKVGQVSLVDL